MSHSVHTIKRWILLLLLYFFVASNYAIENVSNESECPLWHFLEHYRCGIMEHGIINCDEQFVEVGVGVCVTWVNVTSSAEVHHCLFTKKNIIHEQCMQIFIVS